VAQVRQPRVCDPRGVAHDQPHLILPVQCGEPAVRDMGTIETQQFETMNVSELTEAGVGQWRLLEGQTPQQVVLEGVNRSRLFVYNWAAQNLDKVACIYADTPVMDFKSWPGGKGTGIGSPKDWQQCLEAYRLTEQKALWSELMSGAFGRVDPRDDRQWQRHFDPAGDSYRARLKRLADEIHVEFLDLRGAWGESIRQSGKDLDWFHRDPVHANERGEQIIGRILYRYLAPES